MGFEISYEYLSGGQEPTNRETIPNIKLAKWRLIGIIFLRSHNILKFFLLIFIQGTKDFPFDFVSSPITTTVMNAYNSLASLSAKKWMQKMSAFVWLQNQTLTLKEATVDLDFPWILCML